MEDFLPLFSDAIKAISSWKVAGALASLAVLAGLLVRLTKTTIGQKLLSYAKLDGPGRRPWVAAILGGLTACLSALSIKLPWIGVLSATIAGALAGWSATGANESRPSSSDGRAILTELKPINEAAVVELRKQIESAKNETNTAERLKRKADLLDKLLR